VWRRRIHSFSVLWLVGVVVSVLAGHREMGGDVKLERASGGCLGAECRGRTR
jgi:hypothetical protein